MKTDHKAPGLTPEQATARMVAALGKAHAMPPKEQKDMKRGKSLPKQKKA